MKLCIFLRKLCFLELNRGKGPYECSFREWCRKIQKCPWKVNGSEIILGNSEVPSEELLFSLSEGYCHTISNTVFLYTFDKINRKGHRTISLSQI